MSNENALFDDEFDLEFEDDFDSTLASVFEEAAEPEAVDLDPPMKELEEFDPDALAVPEMPATITDQDDGGYRAIPAIAALAF